MGILTQNSIKTPLNELVKVSNQTQTITFTGKVVETSASIRYTRGTIKRQLFLNKTVPLHFFFFLSSVSPYLHSSERPTKCLNFSTSAPPSFPPPPPPSAVTLPPLRRSTFLATNGPPFRLRSGRSSCRRSAPP